MESIVQPDTSFIPSPPAPKRGSRISLRLAGAALLAGSLAAGGLALGHNVGPSSVNASPSGTLASSMVTNSAAAGTGMSGSTNGGMGRGMGMLGRMGAGMTISAINGNTITVSGRGSQSMTVTVTAATTTTYTRAGKSITLADLAKGDRIAVRGTRSAQNAVTATAIQVILPTELGVVTADTGTSLTITSFDSSTHVVTLGTGTTYSKAGATAAASAVTTGLAIEVAGTANSDGSLSALAVTIETPQVRGQVTAVGSGSYTLSTGNGTVTVNVNSSTRYIDSAGATVLASSITTSNSVRAEGSISQDGSTLTALQVIVLPKAMDGSGRLGGGFGGFGQGGSLNGAATPGTATTSTPGSSTTDNSGAGI
jgi:hypothetical protein